MPQLAQHGDTEFFGCFNGHCLLNSFDTLAPVLVDMQNHMRISRRRSPSADLFFLHYSGKTALQETDLSQPRGIWSDMRHTPANLCRLLALLEFSCFGSDLGEAIGEAVEETTIGSFGKGAAKHCQNVLSQAQGIEQTAKGGLGRTDRGRKR